MSKDFKIKNGLEVTTNITASGNYSGSATSTINVGGNITSLGTITAEQITSTDDLAVAGQINLATDIVHTLDADTKIAFATDRITLTAGGVDMIDLREASPDSITFGAAISSHITASGNISGSATSNLTIGGNIIANSGSFSEINLPADNQFIKLGASGDLQIYHNGSNSFNNIWSCNIFTHNCEWRYKCEWDNHSSYFRCSSCF